MGQYDDVDWGAVNGWWLGAPKGKGEPPKSLGILSGTGLDERAALLNSIFNPIEGIGNSMQASRDMVAPGRTGWDRVKSAGDMLSGVAATVAPAVVGAKPATALMEGLLGWSPTRQAAGDAAGQFAMNESGALNMGKSKPKVDAFHTTQTPFTEYNWDMLGSLTKENTAGSSVEDWATSLAKIGPWASDAKLGAKVGGVDMPVEIGGKGKFYKSLDALESAVRKAGGSVAFRDQMRAKGFGHISVNDEEFGGKSFIALSPEMFTVKSGK